MNEIALIQSLIQTLGPVGALIGIGILYWAQRKNGKNHDLTNPTNHELLTTLVHTAKRIEENTAKIPETLDTVRRQHAYIHLLEDHVQDIRSDIDKREAVLSLEREQTQKALSDLSQRIERYH